MKQLKILYTKSFTCKNGIKVKLNVTKQGFTLWSDQNWLVDAGMLNKDSSVRLCKKVLRPWGAQRFDHELIAEKVSKDCINHFNTHVISKVGAKD